LEKVVLYIMKDWCIIVSNGIIFSYLLKLFFGLSCLESSNEVMAHQIDKCNGGILSDLGRPTKRGVRKCPQCGAKFSF